MSTRVKALFGFVTLAVAGALAGCSTGDDAGPAVAVEPAVLYARNCARCHGVDGRGDAEIKKTMPNVRDFQDPAFRARASTDTIVSVVMAGKGQMPAFAQQPEPAEDAGAVGLRPPPGCGQRASGSRAVTTRRAAVALAIACWFFLGASGAAHARSKSKKHRHHHRRTPHGQHTGSGSASEGRSHLKRANALAGDGDCAAAIEEYTKAFELLGDPAVLFNRAECYRRTGDAENAVDDYRAFLEKVPSSPSRADIEAKIVALEAPEPAPREKPRRSRRPRRRRRSPAGAAGPAAAEGGRGAGASPRRRRRRRRAQAGGQARARDRHRARADPAGRRRRSGRREPPVGLGRAVGPGRRRGGRRLSAVTPARRAAAGHRSWQLQAVSVRRARPSTPVLLAAVALLAACEQREIDPAGRGGRRSDADAGSAVGGGDGGRNRPCALPASRPRRP